MKAKKKFIFSIVSVAIVAVFAVVFALAYSTANVKSTFNIAFVAKDVDVTFFYQSATKAAYDANDAAYTVTSATTTSWHVTGRSQTENREIGFIEELDAVQPQAVNNGNAYVQIIAIQNNGHNETDQNNTYGIDYTFTWKFKESGYTVKVEVLDKVSISNNTYVVEDEEQETKTVYTSTGTTVAASNNNGSDSSTYDKKGVITNSEELAGLMKNQCIVLRVTVSPDMEEAEYNDAVLNLNFELKVEHRTTNPVAPDPEPQP